VRRERGGGDFFTGDNIGCGDGVEDLGIVSGVVVPCENIFSAPWWHDGGDYRGLYRHWALCNVKRRSFGA